MNPDNIKDPKHYARWKIEPVHFIMENEIPYAEGNVIKYVMRWKYKGGLERKRFIYTSDFPSRIINLEEERATPAKHAGEAADVPKVPSI